MSKSTKELGLTGGEPTFLGNNFFVIIRTILAYLPETAVHILTNGRNFKDSDLTYKLSKINHPDLMLGIPLYSDLSEIHDYVVQADGAFDETIKGILNLKACGIRVELRVVIHKITYKRLANLAEFIVRNLHFVDHVALMGLEMIGFTRFNMDLLWIDPKDYQVQLYEATTILSRACMNVSIFNHQMCLLDSRLHSFSRKSISDWKNEYMPECEPCVKKNDCGGFFSSANHRYSDNIKPFLELKNL
jgi:His-Xaa-Ser system radical SAM maturase HxsC